MSSLALFSEQAWQYSAISTKLVSDQKIRDFYVSDRGAPRIWQRRGHNQGCGGEAEKGGRFSQKTLILAHFFNKKGHAASAVTRDNTKTFSQLMVCLKSRSMAKISEKRLQPLSV